MHCFYMNLWNSSFIETQLLHPGNVYAAIRKTGQISQMLLRWLDTVFQGQYLPSLSINYVAINEDLEKLTLHLY